MGGQFVPGDTLVILYMLGLSLLLREQKDQLLLLTWRKETLRGNHENPGLTKMDQGQGDVPLGPFQEALLADEPHAKIGWPWVTHLPQFPGARTTVTGLSGL